MCLVTTPAKYSTKIQGTVIQEPFQQSLGAAVQWYDILQVEVDQKIKVTLQVCGDCIRNVKIQAHLTTPTSTPCTPVQCLQSMIPHHPSSTNSLHDLPPIPAPASDVFPSYKQSLTPGSCASILIQQCLPCFGGTIFGRSIADGGDIHVATDSNFHHHYYWSAGNSPSFYNPVYFLPKGQVDKMGVHIKKQRKKPLKTCKPVMPDDAINSCEASYKAANGKKQKTSMDSIDDMGLMALIRCHDIPLFFTNIDPHGEQQKYVLVLISHLFALLPFQAMVVTLYDIGYVVE